MDVQDQLEVEQKEVKVMEWVTTSGLIRWKPRVAMAVIRRACKAQGVEAYLPGSMKILSFDAGDRGSITAFDRCRNRNVYAGTTGLATTTNW